MPLTAMADSKRASLRAFLSDECKHRKTRSRVASAMATDADRPTRLTEGYELRHPPRRVITKDSRERIPECGHLVPPPHSHEHVLPRSSGSLQRDSQSARRRHRLHVRPRPTSFLDTKTNVGNLGDSYLVQTAFASVAVPLQTEKFYDIAGACGFLTSTILSAYYPSFRALLPASIKFANVAAPIERFGNPLKVLSGRQLLLSLMALTWTTRLGSFLAQVCG